MNFKNFLFIPMILLATTNKAAGRCKKCDAAGCLLADGKDIVRVGNTRFYMLNKFSDMSYFKEGRDKCKTLGLQLAYIKNIEEDKAIGRWIENWAALRNFTNTDWWIDVKYNKVVKKYENSDGDPIEYQVIYHKNFIFKSYPIAGEYDEGNYSITGGNGDLSSIGSDTCGTIGIFVQGNYNLKYFVKSGMQYSWREIDCTKVKRRVLCEAESRCDLLKNEWAQERAKYEGVFPLSARKYVVSWERRTREEGIQLCASLGLILLDVHEKQDLCVLNLIKRHRREITHTNFWTGWKYDLREKEFFDVAGNTRGSFGIRISDTRRQTKSIPKFCVSLLYAFEHQNSCNCPWKFLQTVPAKCDLPNGVICQGTLHRKEPCVYDKIFPLKEGSNTFRSDDKATYAVAEVECRRYGLTLTDFKYVVDVNFEHVYDKETVYWVYSDAADDNNCKTVEYKKNGDTYKWFFASDICTKSNFYLCAKNKGSSHHSGRSFPEGISGPANDVTSESSENVGQSRPKYTTFQTPQRFIGEKTTFKRSKHNCHERGMELLSADEPDQLQILQNSAAQLNTTFWIYSKHVDKANSYSYTEVDHKKGLHHICTTMGRNGQPKASNCKHRHRFLCM